MGFRKEVETGKEGEMGESILGASLRKKFERYREEVLSLLSPPSLLSLSPPSHLLVEHLWRESDVEGGEQ